MSSDDPKVGAVILIVVALVLFALVLSLRETDERDACLDVGGRVVNLPHAGHAGTHPWACVKR